MNEDNECLRLLAIFHYVVAGFAALLLFSRLVLKIQPRNAGGRFLVTRGGMISGIKQEPADDGIQEGEKRKQRRKAGHHIMKNDE